MEETIDGVVLASGSAIYELSERYLKDGDTPIVFRLKLKDLVSNEKILVRSVDADMAAMQAGDVSVEIDTMKLTMPSNRRCKVRCNHSAAKVQTVLHSSFPFQVKHLILEVADL